MKRLLLSATLSLLAIAPTNAAIVVPGANGTDGALNITQDTVIDLSKATTGTWDQDNSANSGNGVYDPEKWAVVFKYTSVNVLAGKKLTFKNHATRAPVVWLVSGNVTIAGTVDLSGESGQLSFNPSNPTSNGTLLEPGPGGFRGGASWRGGDILAASGFGPGGGITVDDGIGTVRGRPGSNATLGASSTGSVYGNPSLVPLIGGSGGGGNFSYLGASSGSPGAGGGGALMIATGVTITIPQGGSILAIGGNGLGNSGAGSGGGIRLICHSLSGNGNLNASGGVGAQGGAGSGRIRIERVLNAATLTIQPSPSVIDLPDGSAGLLWRPFGAPEARISAVNGVSAPTNPTSSFGSYTPDLSIPLVSSAIVTVETVNVEQASKVIVRVNPRNGMTVNGVPVRNATEVTATIKQVISENPLKIHWEATVPTLPGHSAIQARIVRP
jgi:hypothetical protein